VKISDHLADRAIRRQFRASAASRRAAVLGRLTEIGYEGGHRVANELIDGLGYDAIVTILREWMERDGAAQDQAIMDLHESLGIGEPSRAEIEDEEGRWYDRQRG
jgi:hypothetical protein